MPSFGCSELYLQARDKPFQPPLESHLTILSECEVKPEVISHVNILAPCGPDTYLDPFFRSYAQEKGLDESTYWMHSDMSRNAYKLAVAKFSRKLPDYDEEDPMIKQAFNFVERTFGPYLSGSSLTSLEDAIKTMPTNSSPGPIWKMLAPNKKEFVLNDYGYQSIISFLEAAKSPGGNTTYWGGSLKNELRPIQKVLDHKTRLFLTAPIEHFLLSKILVGDQHNKMMAATFELPSAIGMSITSANFDAIFKDLLLEFFSCADVGGYDTSIRERFLIMIGLMRFRWLRKEYQSFEVLCMFANMYRDIIWTRTILQNGLIVLLLHQPSGAFTTGDDNTLILYFLFAFCWLKRGGGSYEDFCEHVRLKLCGDDSVCSYTTYGKQFINPDLIIQTWSVFGFKVEFAPCLEFLGHYVIFDGSSYIPIFQTSRVISALYYSGKASLDVTFWKVCSLRILCYTNTEAFPIVDGFALYLLDNYPGLKVHRSCYLSYAEIEDIQSTKGLEASKVKVHDALLKLLRIIQLIQTGTLEECQANNCEEEEDSPNAEVRFRARVDLLH